MRLGIIGGGRAAWAFGWRWREAGEAVSGVHLRASSPSSLHEQLGVKRMELAELLEKSDVVLAAVRDHDLVSLASSLAPLAPPGLHLGHASGCIPSSVFGTTRAFSLHPLRALPPAGTRFDSRGTLLVYEGATASRYVADVLAATWGGRLAAIESPAKALYHSAAVFAANYAALVLDVAERLMHEAGAGEVTRDDLAMLAASAAENWRIAEGTLRFTGPVVRGDASCVETHLTALQADPPARELYASMARELLRIVSTEDPDRVDLAAIAELVSAKRPS